MIYKIFGILFSVLLVAAIATWGYDVRDFAIFVYGKVTYYIIFLLVLLWVREISRSLKIEGFNMRDFLKQHAKVLITALALCSMSFWSSPPRFRVLSDETNLLSVSQAMLLHKTAFNNTMTKRYFGSLNPLSFELEKRPMLFPFLTHLLHLIRGYHYQNPFVLNFILLFALLALAGITISSKLGTSVAMSAQMLLISYPLVVSVSTSGGFDLCASLFLALSMTMLYRFLKSPSEHRLSMLVATLFMFVHARYESFLFVGVMAAGLICFGYLKLDYFWNRFSLYFLGPVLLLPIIIQRILIPHPYENAPGQPAFAVSNFSKFVGIFISGQTNFDFIAPHSHLINWIAFPVAIFTGFKLLSGKLQIQGDYKKHFLLILVTSLGISYLLFFSYYFGDYSHPASARFFLNAAILSALMPVVLSGILPSFVTPNRLRLFALAAIVMYHPVSIGQKFTNIQNLIRETEIAHEFLLERNDHHILVINGRPGQYSSLDFGAVDNEYANRNKTELLSELKRHLYSDIIVIQRIAYDTQRPLINDDLDPDFKLETLKELQSSAPEYIRISKVVIPYKSPSP